MKIKVNDIIYESLEKRYEQYTQLIKVETLEQFNLFLVKNYDHKSIELMTNEKILIKFIKEYLIK